MFELSLGCLQGRNLLSSAVADAVLSLQGLEASEGPQEIKGGLEVGIR